MAGHFCSKTGNIFVGMPMRGVSKPIRESIFSSILRVGAESCVRVASAYIRTCGWSFANVVGIFAGWGVS